MEAAGESWASLLEHLANDREEDALNELMRLSNTVNRSTLETDTQVLDELLREAESRFHKQVLGKIATISKQSISQVRNGNLTKFQPDLARCIHFLRLRVGAELISRKDSQVHGMGEYLAPIKAMLVIQVTVRCQQARDDLRKQLDLVQGKAAMLSNREELGFIEAVETCVNAALASVEFSRDNLQGLLGRDRDAFFIELHAQLCECAAVQVKQIVSWFVQEREITSRWKRRAKELGGLSLPRALSDHQQQPPTPTTVGKVKPLDDMESAMLDLILHELSDLLSLTFELKRQQAGVLQDLEVDLVSYMVSMDELWLTHNITKAVSHSETIENDGMGVNSIVEDTFHIANTCFARAVHSHSQLALEATANHVAGFISDGFLEILLQLVDRDSPQSRSGSRREPATSKAALAAQAMQQSKEEEGEGGINPNFAEALNTLSSCILFSQELERDMYELVMASQLVNEAVAKMTTLLNQSVDMLCQQVVMLDTALVVLRQMPNYELKSGQELDWPQAFVRLQFTQNLAWQSCFIKLSPTVLKLVVEHVVDFICLQELEARILPKITFNALGALQFDKDIRSLCELICAECDSHASDDVEWQIRQRFVRLRHWSHLVNLERQSDEGIVPFPLEALSREQIEFVLMRRVEKDFYY